MTNFIYGAIFIEAIFVGLFFIKFWRKSMDRLFLIFAAAFWLLAIERFVLFATDVKDETKSFIFLLRLMAFVLITLAVIDKNRRGRQIHHT